MAAFSETTPAVANISHRMNPPGMPIVPEDGTESPPMPMRSDIGRGIQPLRGGGAISMAAASRVGATTS